MIPHPQGKDLNRFCLKFSDLAYFMLFDSLSHPFLPCQCLFIIWPNSKKNAKCGSNNLHRYFKAVAMGVHWVHVHPPLKKTTKTLRILDFNVNITILFSLCTSDGNHLTIDKQLTVIPLDLIVCFRCWLLHSMSLRAFVCRSSRYKSCIWIERD